MKLLSISRRNYAMKNPGVEEWRLFIFEQVIFAYNEILLFNIFAKYNVWLQKYFTLYLKFEKVDST